MLADIKLDIKDGWLRPLLVADIHDGYVQGLNDPEVNRFLITPRLRRQTFETVKDFVEQNVQSQNAILFGIWVAGINGHCGTLRLYDLDSHKGCAQIGICIFNKNAWGRGVGSQAIRAVTKWAIEGELQRHCIEAGAYVENHSSIKAFQGAGYEWVRDVPALFPIEGLSGVASILVARAAQTTSDAAAPDELNIKKEEMKVGLGAVQFGMDYGVSNRTGKTPAAEVAAILDTARKLGVNVIDTASLYGDSEAILGQAMPEASQFDIVTKTPQFAKPSLTESEAQVLEDAFHTSLLKLRRHSVYGLLIHRADDLLVPGGDLLMKRMLALKQKGLVRKVGVSVYSGRQIDELLERYSIDLIQLPISVFDQRLLQSGHLGKLKQAGVEIHARSVFLQGLLLMEPDEIPDYFSAVRGKIENYRQFNLARGLLPLQVALGFVSGLPEIDRLICGVNNHQQLEEICAAAQTRIRREDYAEFAIADEAVVNPALWRIRKEQK